MTVTTHHGDCLDVLRGMGEASVDSVVTDPPAGISFMGREWDHHKGGRDAWIAWMREVAAECLRVAKPGAHALVWSLPRTSHWTATAWEDAGWEVRDRVAHLFGTGFPKSLDVGKAIDRAAGAEREVVGRRPIAYADSDCWSVPNLNTGAEAGDGWGMGADQAGGSRPVTAPATDAARQWQGWGTALKPAVEDWWLLRKPLACPTVAAQVLATGTGALNIDACRVPMGGEYDPAKVQRQSSARVTWKEGETSGLRSDHEQPTYNAAGRWPANLVHDGSPEVLAAFAAFATHGAGAARQKDVTSAYDASSYHAPVTRQMNRYGDEGSPARFFPALGFGEDELRFHYSAKASKADRAGSKHPTVKPLALMRWLCRLVTPPGGTVLDCFAGTGVTGVAALREGFSAVLIEREAEYHADILARLARYRAEAPLLAEVAA